MSRNFLDGRKSSGNAPEKSNFAQTCHLLSQFLKGKGSLRDLPLGINGKLEASSGRAETCAATTTTMNYLSTETDKSGYISTQHVKSMNLFPQYAYSTLQDAINNTNSSSEQGAMESKTAQMTIFYDGRVLVFDNFSAAKAKEVMLLASKGTTSNTINGVSTSNIDKIVDDGSSQPMPSTSNNIISNSGSIQAEKKETQLQSQPIGSDLPIARRSSLHRFLEKRKDRAGARAPYQLNNPSAESTKQQFDLNL